MALVLFSIVATGLYVILSQKKSWNILSNASIQVFLLFIIVPVVTLAGKTDVIEPNSTRIITCGVIVVSAILSLYKFATKRHKLTYENESGFLIAIMIIGIVIGSLSLANLDSVFNEVPTYIAIFLGFLLAITESESQEFPYLTASALSALSISTILLYFTWPEIATVSFSSLGFEGEYAGRLTGPLLHPNALGSLMALGFIFAWNSLIGLRRTLSLISMLFVVFLTDQRSAQIAIFVFVLTILFTSKKRTLFGWFVTTLTVAAAVLYVFIAGSEMADDLVGRRADSVSQRFDIYRFVFENISTILPFGIGVNGLYLWTRNSWLPVAFAHAHNSWLTMLVTGGLLSGISFILLTLISTTRSYVQQNKKSFAAIISVLALSLMESPIYAGSNWSIVPVATLSMYLIVIGQAGSATWIVESKLSLDNRRI